MRKERKSSIAGNTYDMLGIRMKVGLVYTSTTKELIALVEEEVKKNLGKEVTLLSYEDASILAEVREAGFVTAAAAARLISMFMQAVNDGADAILNICSSVGEVADAALNIGKFTGVPIVRIDEDMCREAVRLGKRIGVVATLPTTLEPTKSTIKRVAREMGRQVALIDALVDGAFGLNPEQFQAFMQKKCEEIASQVDVILFCQGSMAYCEDLIHQSCKLPVVSSPRFGAVSLKNALAVKGCLSTEKE